MDRPPPAQPEILPYVAADRGLADRTLWIVYGDHGEAFGQRPGNFGHTFFLYEEKCPCL